MATLSELGFEIERRVIVFHKDTTMPDNSQLGFTGNPNNVIEGNTAGETLLYNSPSGTQFIDKSADPHVRYVKSQDFPGGIWEILSSSEQSLRTETEIFTLLEEDITKKYVTLLELPSEADNIKLSVQNAPTQHYGNDFAQDETFLKRITWESYGLDGFLEIGDKITITYTV